MNNIGGFHLKKPEFTKTSLHNHFGGKNADYARGNAITSYTFDISSAKAKLDNAFLNDYQLLGMTNHNFFWKDEYEQLNQYIKDKNYEISLIPGAELDIVDDRTGKKLYLHVVILVSPNSNLDAFATAIKTYTTANKEYAITIEQLTEIAYLNKCILIPHGAKQDKRSALKNFDSFDEIMSVRGFFPILIEDKTKAQREILESRIRAHLTSEEFEWLSTVGSVSTLDQGTDFSTIKQPTYIWGESNFDSLFYCAIMGKDRVLRETDIIDKSRYLKKIVIKNNGGVLGTATLTMSHGLNSIIGNSGSGKTLLLNLIKKKLDGNNLFNAVSATNANYDAMYQNTEITIYDNNDKVIEPKDINVFEGENLYKQIVSTLNYDKTKLLTDLKATPSFMNTQKIIDEFNQSLDTYIRNKISINDNTTSIDESLVKAFASIEYLKSNISLPNVIEYIINSKLRTDKVELNSALLKIDEDTKKATDSFDSIKQLLTKYDLAGSVNQLLPIRFSLLKKILLAKTDLKTKAINLDAKILVSSKLSAIVSEYNETIGQRAKVANESKQIVADEFENILNTLKSSVLTEQEIVIPTLNKDDLIASVIKNDELIKLENLTVVDKIDYEDFTLFFDSAIGSAQGKILKREFESFKNSPVSLFEQKSVKKFADIFVMKKYHSSNIYKFIPESLIKFDIMIQNPDNEYQKIDTLSAGQLSKIYINILIDSRLKSMENNAIILYDQPDNNLEKEFILYTLGEKLAKLKRKYQVIITTHEPLLVVNSDSNNIIRVANDPVGGVNKITFENLTMYDVGDKKAAIEKIAKLIDGDRNAIRLRNQIYGGSNI